jgi:hypothetical protein
VFQQKNNVFAQYHELSGLWVEKKMCPTTSPQNDGHQHAQIGMGFEKYKCFNKNIRLMIKTYVWCILGGSTSSQTHENANMKQATKSFTTSHVACDIVSQQAQCLAQTLPPQGSGAEAGLFCDLKWKEHVY